MLESKGILVITCIDYPLLKSLGKWSPLAPTPYRVNLSSVVFLDVDKYPFCHHDYHHHYVLLTNVKIIKLHNDSNQLAPSAFVPLLKSIF